jgi:hypothetical protein
MSEGITETVTPSRGTYEVLEEMVSAQGTGIHSGDIRGGSRGISGEEEV